MKPGEGRRLPLWQWKEIEDVRGDTAQPRAPTAAELNQLSETARAGPPAELEQVARALTHRYPTYGMAWKVLGVAMQMQGRSSLTALEQAAALLPQDPETHRNLGVAQCDAGRPDAGLLSFRRALTIKADYLEAHLNMGSVLQCLGRLAEAADSYRRALQISPTLADTHRQLGDVMSELGQLEQAIERYRQALALKPDLAEAHNNLGNALAKAGRLEEAVDSYRRVLALQPDVAATHSNLGKVLLDLRRFDESVQSCRRALALNPALAEAHNNLGNALLDLDRVEEAIASYRSALLYKPDFPEAYNALGNAMRSAGRFEAALVNYRKAIELKPDFAESYNNLGVALRLLGHTAEAQINCHRALELNPTCALALAALAEAQSDRGRFAEAEQLLTRAVVIDPNLVEAWISLGRVRKMTVQDTAWLAAAQRLLSQPLRPRESISLRYAVGKYFDDLKDFDQAFSSYQRANDLTRQHSPKHDRQALRRDTDRLIQTYDRTGVQRLRAFGNPSARPIFVIGMPRSGTSLAEQILASHPAVFGAGELSYWHDWEARNGSFQLPDPMRLARLADEYLHLIDRLAPEASFVVDKMPTNFMAVGLIHAAFPNARFIHMQRNPIDTCLSIYFQDFGARISYANDLADLANFYAEYLRVMQHWRRTLDRDALLDVPYEALVEQQEVWSRRMIEFVGLTWDARCLDFQRTDRSVVTASKWQVRQEINSTSIERWRNYERHLGPLLGLLQRQES